MAKSIKLSIAIITILIATLFASCTKDEGVNPSKAKVGKLMDGEGGGETPPQLPPPPHGA